MQCGVGPEGRAIDRDQVGSNSRVRGSEAPEGDHSLSNTSTQLSPFLALFHPHPINASLPTLTAEPCQSSVTRLYQPQPERCAPAPLQPSTMPPRCQSLAANLPPELLKMIFKLTQSPTATVEAVLANQREAHAQNAVCSAWRGVPDALGDLSAASVEGVVSLTRALHSQPAVAERMTSLWVKVGQSAWTGYRPASVSSNLSGLLQSGSHLRQLTLDLAPVGREAGLALSWLEMGMIELSLAGCASLTRLRILQPGQMSVSSFLM